MKFISTFSLTHCRINHIITLFRKAESYPFFFTLLLPLVRTFLVTPSPR